MESSISTQKWEARKVKKGKEKKKKKLEDEVLPKKMNKNLIDQMDFSGPKLRRRKFSCLDKVED